MLPGARRGELVAVTESVAGTMRIDADSLRTLGPVKYTDGVKGELTTAHPTLQRDGSLINLAVGVRHACGRLHEVACFLKRTGAVRPCCLIHLVWWACTQYNLVSVAHHTTVLNKTQVVCTEQMARRRPCLYHASLWKSWLNSPSQGPRFARPAALCGAQARGRERL